MLLRTTWGQRVWDPVSKFSPFFSTFRIYWTLISSTRVFIRTYESEDTPNFECSFLFPFYFHGVGHLNRNSNFERNTKKVFLRKSIRKFPKQFKKLFFAFTVLVWGTNRPSFLSLKTVMYHQINVNRKLIQTDDSNGKLPQDATTTGAALLTVLVKSMTKAERDIATLHLQWSWVTSHVQNLWLVRGICSWQSNYSKNELTNRILSDCSMEYHTLLC